MKRIATYDRNQARTAKKTAKVELTQSIPEQAWSVDVNAHWSALRDTMQELSRKSFPQAKRQRRQLYFSDACWDLVVQRKELRIMHRDQLRKKDELLIATCFQAWKSKGAVEQSFFRQIVHVQNLQCALTFKMRQDIDSRFRRTKKREWKQWIQNQMEQKIWDLKTQHNATIFNVFQPKKVVDKHLGKRRRQHPGLKSHAGEWLLSRESIAVAWQAHFAETENADDACMKEMIDKSRPITQPISVDEL